KYQLVAHDAAIAYGRSVLCRHDRTHTRQPGGLADVETTNAPVCDRTTENFAGQDAWQCHVIGVDHAPCDAIDRIRLGDALTQECVFRHAASPLYIHGVLRLCAWIERYGTWWLPYHAGLELSTGRKRGPMPPCRLIAHRAD